MIQHLTLSGNRARNRRRSRAAARHLLSEQLETRTLLAGDLMQNPAAVTDVNADGLTTPIDALFILNELNAGGARSLVSGEDAVQTRMFYDVNGDEFLSPVDALLVLNELNAEGEDNLLVQIRLEVVNAENEVIDAIDPDNDFFLNAYVMDLTGRDGEGCFEDRSCDGGVFAAYMDVNYSSSLVAPNTDIDHQSPYGNAPSGSLAEAGLIDEVGSIDGLTELGPEERLLFTVGMVAQNNGTATFAPSFADLSPLHDVLLYGFDEGIAEDEIMFVGTSLQIGSSDQPVAEDDSYDAVRDQMLEIDAQNGVLANDVDPNGGTLTAALVDQASNGSVDLADDGSFTYTPSEGFTGVDTFTYVASNVGATSNVATVEINVMSVNRPPVAVDDAYETDEDVQLEEIEGVLINDSDPDGDALNARLVTLPSNGTLQLNGDGTFVYTPDEDFFGSDAFTYVANDGELDSNVATAMITVRAVNDGPIANPDFYTTPEDTLLSIVAEVGVLANDIDPEGDGLTAALITNVSHGNLEFNEDGSFVYSPEIGFTGQDTFTYVADDGTSTSDPTTVTITVTGDVLVKFHLVAKNSLGTPITSIRPGGNGVLEVFVEDVSSAVPDGVFAAYMDVLYTSNATLSGDLSFDPLYENQRSGDTSQPGLIDEAGAFDGFTPLGGGEFLLFSVPFVAIDLGTIVFESDPADLSPSHDVLLYNVNTAVPTELIEYGFVEIVVEQGEPPVAVDDEYETLEDVRLDVSVEDGVLANDIDPDGDELIAVLVDSPANGTLDLSLDGSFSYVPNENFFGQDSFTYQASDGANLSNVANVTIDVVPVNDAPIAVDDFYPLRDMEQLIIDAENGVLANDIEVEGETMTAVLVDDTENGVLELAQDGSFVYTPEAGFVGRDIFTYQAQSGDLLSNVATVVIEVGNIAPSSIHGVVYFDVNNDGVINDGEDRIANVEITLRGTNLLGEDVFRQTTTATDGSYEFREVLQGAYVLTEFQPAFTVDGKDTINGEESLRNDRFIIDLPAGIDDGSYNFGERGLEPQFVNNTMFFASRQIEGLWTMIDADGQSRWYNAQLAWSEFDSITVDLANNMTTAVITARTGDLVQNSTIRLFGNHDVHLTGDEDGYIFRLEGQPEEHGLQRPSSLSSSAVDAVFADDE